MIACYTTATEQTIAVGLVAFVIGVVLCAIFINFVYTGKDTKK